MVHSCSLNPSVIPATEPVLVLPRGRHALSRATVAESQRDRLLVAMADVAAEKGYAHASVADVVASAGVSRRTFYEHFDNKDDCFFAAYEVGVDLLLAGIADAAESAGTDPALRARAASEAYLALLAANPRFAKTFLVEILGAGPAALERRELVHQRFAFLIASEYESAREAASLRAPAAYRFRALVGAIHELVIERLVSGGAERLPELIDAVLDIETCLLAPE